MIELLIPLYIVALVLVATSPICDRIQSQRDKAASIRASRRPPRMP
jgi:hypothetical protein